MRIEDGQQITGLTLSVLSTQSLSPNFFHSRRATETITGTAARKITGFRNR